jgi:hypothetical protein
VPFFLEFLGQKLVDFIFGKARNLILNFQLPEYIYIYTRVIHPTEKVIHKINEALKLKHIDPSKVHLVDQTNCPEHKHVHDHPVLDHAHHH